MAEREILFLTPSQVEARIADEASDRNLMGPDALYTPSTTPPDIYIMDTPDVIVGSLFDATALAIWKANRDILKPVIKAAIAKHPTAYWVPTAITPGELYYDGVHPAVAGHAQRGADLVSAITTVKMLGRPAAKLLLAAVFAALA